LALSLRRRAGVFITYITSASGKAPYSKKVIKAPKTVPVLLVASATLIISTT